MDHHIFSKLKFRALKGRPLMTRFFQRHKISIPESKLVDFNSTPFKDANPETERRKIEPSKTQNQRVSPRKFYRKSSSHGNNQSTLAESTKTHRVDKGNQTIFDENSNIVTKGSQRPRKTSNENAQDELNLSRKRKRVDAATSTDDIQLNQTDKEKIALKSSVTSAKKPCVLDISASSGVGYSESTTTQAGLKGSSFHKTVNTATSVDASNFLAPAELNEQSFNRDAINTNLGVDLSRSAPVTDGIFKTPDARPHITAQDGVKEKSTDNTLRVKNRHQGLSLSTSRRSEERRHTSHRQHTNHQLLLGTDGGMSTTGTSTSAPPASPGQYFFNPPETNTPVDDTTAASDLRHSQDTGPFTTARANYILDKFFPLDRRNLPGIKHWKSIMSETPRRPGDTSRKYPKAPRFSSKGTKRFFEICDYVKSWSEYEKMHATNMKGK